MLSKNNCGLVLKSTMLKKIPKLPSVMVLDGAIIIVSIVYYGSRCSHVCMYVCIG